MTDLAKRVRRLEREVSALREEVRRLAEREPAGPPGVEELLRRRGLSPLPDDGRPAPLVPAGGDETDAYYRLLKRYSFRIFMRDLIARGAGARTGRWPYCSDSTARRYLAELSGLGLVAPGKRGAWRLSRPEVTSFGETLEWFATEVLRREFGLRAERGLRVPGLPSGGDYDILASAPGGLLYVEVKSSPPKHIDGGEVAAFARRLRELAPEAAVFLVDTQLRLLDKIVPLLRRALEAGSPLRPPGRKDGIFVFPGPVYAVGGKPSLERNLAWCLEDFRTASGGAPRAAP